MWSDDNAGKYKNVLTGQIPRFEHLRMGYFRQRAHIFRVLLEKFADWISKLESSDLIDRIPVFWIGGRSGEGKSVLLLQLVAELVQADIISPIVQLASGEDLPKLLENLTTDTILSDFNSSRIFVVVDDLYSLQNRDEWDEKIRRSTSLQNPSIAIITCGPTEQLEQADSRLNDQLEINKFSIPHLSLDECKDFADWYCMRTGSQRDLNMLTIENPLLVQLVFELAQGVSISAFAKRFKKRLSSLNLFDVTKTILAMNALYLDAPYAILSSNENRDALERLCAEDQLHFRVISQSEDTINNLGIRLAHPHLAWLLFVEWVEPPATISKSWARELSKTVRLLESYSYATSLHALLHRLLTTDHLAGVDETQSSMPKGERKEFFVELYRLHTEQHQGYPSIDTLGRWLEFEYKFSDIHFFPEPLEYAVSQLLNQNTSSSIHSSIASWVWLLSESRPDFDRERLQNAVVDFFSVNKANIGSGSAIVRILSQSKNKKAAIDFTNNWLLLDPSNPQAYQPISKMLSDKNQASKVLELSRKWYLANKSNPSASNVVVGLLSTSPDNDMVKLAVEWLTENLMHSAASNVITGLLSISFTDEIIAIAVNWLLVNRTNPAAPNVVASIVAANPKDEKVWKIAENWISANEQHPNYFDLLRVMVRHGNQDMLNRASE